MILILSIIVLVASILFFIAYYFPYINDITQIYLDYPIATVMTILITLRITFLLYGSVFFVRKWMGSKSKHLFTIPSIFSWIFIFLVLAKIMDYVLYTAYELNFYFGYPNEFLLEITKIRFMVIIINILPLFLLGLHLYLYKRNLYLSESSKVNVSSRKILILSILYIIFFSILIVIVQEMNVFSLISALLTVVSFGPVIYFFYNAHKTGSLQEIRPLLVSIGFFCYVVSLLILPIIVNMFIPDIHDGEIVSLLYLEISTIVFNIMFFSGFI